MATVEKSVGPSVFSPCWFPLLQSAWRPVPLTPFLFVPKMHSPFSIKTCRRYAAHSKACSLEGVESLAQACRTFISQAHGFWAECCRVDILINCSNTSWRDTQEQAIELRYSMNTFVKKPNSQELLLTFWQDKQVCDEERLPDLS